MNRHPRRLLNLVLLAALALTTQAHALDQQALDNLKALFDNDPAQAFVEAARLFEEPKAKGDLEGMMAIIRLTSEAGGRCKCPAAVDDMADAAIPIAEKAGRWALLGDIHAARAAVLWECGYLSGAPVEVGQRTVHYLDLAAVAYARAGSEPPLYADLRRKADAAMDAYRAYQASELAQWDKHSTPACRDRFVPICDAIGEGRDAEAVRLAEAAVAWLRTEPYTPEEEDYLACELALLLWVRGMEVILPDLLRFADERSAPGAENWHHNYLLNGCARSWMGGDDDWLRAMRLCCLRQIIWREVPFSPGEFAEKLRVFGRSSDLDQLAEQWLAWEATQDVVPVYRAWLVYGARLIEPTTTAELRSRLTAAAIRALRQAPSGWPDWASVLETLHSRLPSEQWREWAPPVLSETATAALALPEPAARSQALSRTADMYRWTEMPREEAQCRTLAAAIAANDPKTLLQCALTSAQSLAAEAKWDGLTKTLEPATANQPPSPELLQAALLLHEANLHLNKPTEADAWLAKACDLVNTLPLSPAEKANYLLTMANLCDLAAQNAARDTTGQP